MSTRTSARDINGRCLLKCRDTTLLSFEFNEDEFGTPTVDIIDIDPSVAHLMPWGLAPDSESLYRWLSVRALPHNRRFAEELCRSMGFSTDDLAYIYAVSCGLSLNDSYWTPLETDDRSFDEVNFYRNEFSEVLSAVAYTGNSPAHGSLHGLTPELTTDGTLRKAWRISPSGERLLYKGATEGWYPGEPISELIASWLACEAALNVVVYGLECWDAELCSTCACFCTEDRSYTPFAVATGINDLGTALSFTAKLGEREFESLRDILVFDCLICNVDRHFTNFGLMRDVDSGIPLGLAPIFDNGRGLLPMLPTSMIGDAKYQLATLSPAFGGRSFDQLAARVMGPQQQAWLSRLSGVDLMEITSRFEGSELEPLVAERCKELAPLIAGRIENLLKVDAISLEEMRPMLERAWQAKGAKLSGNNLCPAEQIPRPAYLPCSAMRAAEISACPKVGESR